MIYHLNKVIKQQPELIQKIVEKLFSNQVLSLFAFKHDYDPDTRKENDENLKKYNIFNKKEINKSLKHINDEMEKSAEEFYTKKKDKEKGGGLSV